MIKTRIVSKYLYKNYLKKAEEYFDAMNDQFDKQNFNACVLNAIHCAISSSDALTVFFKGVRHAGEKHEDVIRLLLDLDLDENILTSKTRQLSNLLSIKNQIEYEEKLSSDKGAEIAKNNAERFFGWVKEVLKE